MNDANWKRLIARASAAYREAMSLRCAAEDEYERRYGVNPADVGDDWWIDTMEGCPVDFKAIKRHAANAAKGRE